MLNMPTWYQVLYILRREKNKKDGNTVYTELTSINGLNEFYSKPRIIRLFIPLKYLSNIFLKRLLVLIN